MHSVEMYMVLIQNHKQGKGSKIQYVCVCVCVYIYINIVKNQSTTYLEKSSEYNLILLVKYIQEYQPSVTIFEPFRVLRLTSNRAE